MRLYEVRTIHHLVVLPVAIFPGKKEKEPLSDNVHSSRKVFAPRGVNSFLEEVILLRREAKERKKK